MCETAENKWYEGIRDKTNSEIGFIRNYLW